MSDSLKILCPKCHSSNVQLSFEQENKLRLAFDCQQCSNRFFADEDLKVKDFNLKDDSIKFNVTVEFNSGNTSELDQKIIELVQKGNYLKAVKFYQDEKNTSLKEAKTYVDNLTQFIEKEPIIKTDNEIFKEELIELVRQGKRYKAIQLFKEKEGSSWKDARDYINHIVEFDSDIKKPGCLFYHSNVAWFNYQFF